MDPVQPKDLGSDIDPKTGDFVKADVIQDTGSEIIEQEDLSGWYEVPDFKDETLDKFEDPSTAAEEYRRLVPAPPDKTFLLYRQVAQGQWEFKWSDQLPDPYDGFDADQIATEMAQDAKIEVSDKEIDDYINLLKAKIDEGIQCEANFPDSPQHARFLQIEADIRNLQQSNFKKAVLETIAKRWLEQAVNLSDVFFSTENDPTLNDQLFLDQAAVTGDALELINSLYDQDVESIIVKISLIYQQAGNEYPFYFYNAKIAENLERINDRVMRINRYPSNLLHTYKMIYYRCGQESENLHDSRLQSMILKSYQEIFDMAHEKYPDYFDTEQIHPDTIEDIRFYIDNIDGSLANEFAKRSVNLLGSKTQPDAEILTDLQKIQEYRLLASVAETGNEEVNEALRRYLAKYQLDWDKLHESWSTVTETRRRTISVAHHLAYVDTLESRSPNICKRLNSEENIEFFGRYPIDMLLSQDYKRDKDVPYGVVLYPKADWNGAFIHTEDVLSDTDQQLSGHGYSTRVCEASGKYSAARRLLKFNQKYGEQNKIAYLILGGHGTEDSVTFGHERNLNELMATSLPQDSAHRRTVRDQLHDPKLTTEDLTHDWVERLKTFFEPNFTIIFVSCSTGLEGGIANWASARGDAVTIAPIEPDSPEKIVVTKDDNGLKFDVAFSKGGMQYSPPCLVHRNDTQ